MFILRDLLEIRFKSGAMSVEEYRETKKRYDKEDKEYGKNNIRQRQRDIL